jgi:hypothetical protein
MRPRFRKPVALSRDEVMARFVDCVESGGCPYVTRLYEHQIELTVPDERQHFWSPYLNLLVVRDADSSGAESSPSESSPSEASSGESSSSESSQLDGRFGPNVGVWTMFVAVYAVLGISGAVGLMMGLSQWQIGQEPSGIWIAAGCLGAIVVVYGIALIGQRLAAPQMSELRAYVEETIGADGVTDQ